MKISYIPKEGRKEILIILIDDDSWREIHIAIFGKRPKLPREISSLSEWQELFNILEYQLTKQYALRRLSSQSYHSYQLKKLILERLVQPSTIQKVIEECTAWGYLNDQIWLESFMQSHLKRHSQRALIAKLQAKGLPMEILQDIREQWQDPEIEKKSIKNLLQTRYRSKDLTQPQERQKIQLAFMRKGYSFVVIREVLEERLKEMLVNEFQEGYHKKSTP